MTHLPDWALAIGLALFGPPPLEPIVLSTPPVGPEAPPWTSTASDFAVFQTPPWPPPFPPEPFREPSSCELTGCCGGYVGSRIIPAFDDGRWIGFKLFSIRPHSIYAKVGLKNGDVVVGINGHRITSPDRALAVYAALKDATTLRLEIRRHGRRKFLTYRIPR